MAIEQTDRPDDPRLADYRNVRDPILLREGGVFIAEGRLVVRTLLADTRRPVRSVLVTPPALEALRDFLDARPDVPVYVAPPGVLAGVVGFDIHRGCLAAGERPAPLPVADALTAAAGSPFIVIIDGVSNADNIGAIFRNARAFGAGCVILGPGCCDPLYRKAIRVSIGATLRLPFAEVERWHDGLEAVKAAGYRIAALTVRGEPEELLAFARRRPPKLAWLLGHEGHGVSADAEAFADDAVRIDMVDGVDSVNVAAAAGIAMYVCSRPSTLARDRAWAPVPAGFEGPGRQTELD